MIRRRYVELWQPETFGEMNFLMWERKSNFSVVADEDVTLCIIEGHYVSILFNMIPGFAGRFYKYLVDVLSRRLYSRERLLYHY